MAPGTLLIAAGIVTGFAALCYAAHRWRAENFVIGVTMAAFIGAVAWAGMTAHASL